MLRLASDENFIGEIVRGLFRRRSTLELVRVQDAGLIGVDDPGILAWAATEGRILLTHDRTTMPDVAYDRVRAALPMPGVIVVDNHLAIGQAIEEILLVVECSEPEDCENLVLFLPL